MVTNILEPNAAAGKKRFFGYKLIFRNKTNGREFRQTEQRELLLCFQFEICHDLIELGAQKRSIFSVDRTVGFFTLSNEWGILPHQILLVDGVDR